MISVQSELYILRFMSCPTAPVSNLLFSIVSLGGMLFGTENIVGTRDKVTLLRWSRRGPDGAGSTEG